MRKIFYLLVIALSCIFVMSCSDDNTPASKQSVVQVLSAQTSFPAEGATKSIAVVQGAVSAHCEDSWITVVSDGNNIRVTASPNHDRQSRHTMIVITSTGKDSTLVDIDQDGMVLDLAYADTLYGDDAIVKKFYMRHTFDVEVSSSVDWLSATVSGDSMSVNVSANNTGQPRKGWLYYKSGNITDSLSVLQFETDKDILGHYRLYFYRSEVQYPFHDKSFYGWFYDDVYIRKLSDNSYAIQRSGTGFRTTYEFNIPITVRKDFPQFTITNQDSVGVYQPSFYSEKYPAKVWLELCRDWGSYYNVYQYDAYNKLLNGTWTANWTWKVDADGEQTYPLSLDDGPYGCRIYNFDIAQFNNDAYEGRILIYNTPYLKKIVNK